MQRRARCANATYQPRGGLGRSTIAADRVGDRREVVVARAPAAAPRPGVLGGVVEQRSAARCSCRVLRQFGRGVAQPRQVVGARPGRSAPPSMRVGALVARAAGDTRLSGSFRSPKTIACVGQACSQAGTISPSRIGRLLVARPRSWPPRSAARSRCTSPSRPRLRTVTSGLKTIFSTSGTLLW